MAKIAACDTFLPRGGGPNGDMPLFVAQGTVFTSTWWAMHRDQDVFGPDADDFKPERWQDSSLRPFWSYVPFGGGPRVCLGQQYAQSEVYYITTRLMQHLRHIEPRGPITWRGKVTLTLSLADGTKVALRSE